MRLVVAIASFALLVGGIVVLALTDPVLPYGERRAKFWEMLPLTLGVIGALVVLYWHELPRRKRAALNTDKGQP